MNNESSAFEKWKAQNEYLNKLKAERPELFAKSQQIDSETTLRAIGITLPTGTRPLGYLKYTPFDFVVEEIGLDGQISTVDYDEPRLPLQSAENKTIFAELVKIGIPTAEAIKELSRTLNIPAEQIGRAGLKDAVAVTSQKLSFRGINAEQLLNLPKSNYFLKSLAAGNHQLDSGNLLGNRFTILVRTENHPDETWLQAELKRLYQSGFWNFFWLQRFGTRLLSHWWGALILRGDYEGAVKSFLCDFGPRDTLYYKNLRRQASQLFGDWEGMQKLFAPLPYSLRHELAVVEYLSHFRLDYVGALKTILDQTQLWVYAYASFLANRLLSLAAHSNQNLPETLPLPLSYNKSERKLYQRFFAADRIAEDFEKYLRPFNIHINSRKIPTKIVPTIHTFKVLPEGVVICFDLPKGAYATTFFAHLFTLAGGLPYPAWLKKTEYDVKEILQQGSLAKTREVFKDYTIIKEEDAELSETNVL
jgi:TruD family tRNA pseudouridine synthase